jgi:hypothetical protein
VANVEVHASSAGGPRPTPSASSVSDAAGTFVLRGIEPGSYSVVAEADGLHGEIRQPIHVPLAGTIENIRIEVSAATQVTGRVLMSKTLQPCSEGAVTLGLPDLRMPPVEDEQTQAAVRHSVHGVTVRVGAGGVVHFAALSRGRYYVTVQCKDGVLSEGPRFVDVGTAALTDLTWKVGPGLTLTVLTVDERNQPVPNAQFILNYPRWSDSRPLLKSFGSTDERGRYTFKGELVPGTYEIAGAQSFEVEPVRVELRDGDAPASATLRMAGSGSILATVRTRDGRLLDSLTVTAVLTSGASTDARAPLAGATPARPSELSANPLGEGRYRVAPLKPGRYEVRVDDRVNPTVVVGVAVASGEVTQTNVEIDRDGHVRGRVVDEGGVAVPDVWVTAHATGDNRARMPSRAASPLGGEVTRVLTDAEGRFVIDRLVEGDAKYSLRAEQSTGEAAVENGISAGDDVVLRLPAARSLGGTIVGECDDPTKPVTVYAMNQDTGQTSSQTLPGPGSFQLAVGQGHLQIAAVCRGGGGMARTTTDVSANADVTGLRLTLEATSH